MMRFPRHKSYLFFLAALMVLAAAHVRGAPNRDGIITEEMKKKLDGVRTDVPRSMNNGSIRIITSIDKKVIHVGDIIHYDLIVEVPENSMVGMPPPGSQLGSFMIRDYHLPTDENEDEAGAWERIKRSLGLFKEEDDKEKQRKFSFEITSYETGDLLIPPVPVIIMDPAGDVHALIAEPARIRVAPVTDPEELTIKDIESPVEVPVPFSAYWYLVAIPAVLLAAVPLGYWLYRRRSREEEPEIDLRPAHVIAREELDILKAEGLLEAGEYEKFYTRLSRILRKYLSLRYSMYALEYTTEEISRKLSRMDVDFSTYEKIKRFLEESDKVKFAKHTPGLEDRNRAFSRVSDIIEATREQEEEDKAA